MKKLLIILLLFISLSIQATTYYLSPTGSDAAAGGIATPWFTLNKAWTVITAGDIVYMRGGSYAYTTQQYLTGKNGSAGNLIKIYAYPGETPILTGTGEWTWTTYRSGICFVGDYCHFKGLEIINYTQRDQYVWFGFVGDNSNHNVFELLNSHHNGLGMALLHNSNDNLILNCDFHHNYDPLTADTYGNADGLDVSSITTGVTNTIRGCRFWNNSDDGIDLYNSDGFTLIDSCWSWNHGYREDGTTTGGDGNGIKLGVTATDQSTVFLRTVTNCLSFKNRGNGIDQNGGNTKMYIYNNVNYSNYIGFNFSYLTLNNVHVFRNNISFDNIAFNWIGVHTVATVDHNSYDASWQSTGLVATSADFASLDTTGVSGARQANGSLPLLRFLHLVSTSDLINAGVDVGLPFRDNAPDIGAYEYKLLIGTSGGKIGVSGGKIGVVK